MAMLRCALLLIFVATGSASAGDPAACLVEAARAQVGVTVNYDGSYQRIAFPGGDVPMDRGVCTDVIIRAYRRLGLDLQVLVHDDMREAWSAYPNRWRMAAPDANIDHRRVPNLATFFRRHGQVLAVQRTAAAYGAGDIVTWKLPSGLPHIGIVSDRRSPDGVPLVVHNIGAGAKEDDILFRYPVTGHFRYLPAQARAQGCI